jgi:hypothetical protein
MNKKMIIPISLVLVLIGLVLTFGFNKNSSTFVDSIATKVSNFGNVITGKPITSSNPSTVNVPNTNPTVTSNVNNNNGLSSNNVSNNVLSNAPITNTNIAIIPAEVTKLPDQFPSDAPALTNGQLTNAGKLEGGVYYTQYIIDKNINNPKQAFELYLQQVKAQGWAQDNPSINESTQSYIIRSQKGTNDTKIRALTIIVNPADNDVNKTIVNVQVTEL